MAKSVSGLLVFGLSVRGEVQDFAHYSVGSPPLLDIVAIISFLLLKSTPESKIVTTERKSFDWQGLITFIIAMLAINIVISQGSGLGWLSPAVIIGTVILSLFAVTSAQKSLAYGHNAEVAVLLGITTAVGGGVLRDILLNRIPVILEKEIYASAALMGAFIVVLGNYLKWLSSDWISIIALIICFGLRLLSLRYHWNLPVYSNNKKEPDS